MKSTLIVALASISMATSVNALDCSFTGGKIEAVAKSANPGPSLATLERANTKINTLISLCAGRGVEMTELQDAFVDLTTGYPEGTCDPSAVGGQSERAAANVIAKFNQVNSAANTVLTNVDTLTSVLLKCIGATVE